MNKIIDTNLNISDIALAYYDDIEEVLKEVTEETLYFSVTPFSSQYKRLYLIGDLIYKNIVKISANIYGTSAYTVKLESLEKFTSLMDFEESSNVLYIESSSNYLNTIPVDILITSHENIDTSFYLDIDLSIGDEEE